MRIVLLSGGSGKRLWPLSNEIRSKIYLKLLRSADGGMESMLQRICGQLDTAGLLQSSYILTHHSQVEITKNHVGERIPIISEPYKKGTFTAAALAAAYFHSQVHASPEETICMIPVDSFVDLAFFDLFHKIPGILRDSQAELALLGCIPKHPSNQYGYIVPIMSGNPDYYHVSEFVEKPDETYARHLINKKAMWNCGVFAFRLSYMLSNIQKHNLPLTVEEMIDRYEHLPELSFDNEVVEKNRHSVVIPFDGKWNDIGNWSTLTDHLDSGVIGLGDISADSINTHLVNELTCPIYVIGVRDLIVAASPDGILVASKDKSDQIKQKIQFVNQRHMIEEKRWGSYRVLDHSKIEHDNETLTAKIVLNAGENTSYHVHKKRKEIWTIVSGTGEFIMDGILYAVQTGDTLHIPPGVKHAVKALTPLACMVVQIGSELVDEDIVRLTMNWETALQYGQNNN